MNQQINIGHSNLSIHRVGLGCMGMSEFYGPSNDEDSIQLLNDALELGVNFFDTADMYGCGHNETLLGKAFKGRWDQLTIATKFGVERGPNGERFGVNGRPEYVKACCDQSLKRLGVDQIDLYYMHRKDPEVEIEETVGAMKELVEAGKVASIGLSEVDSNTLKRAHAVHPISALQTEFSMWSREPLVETFETCKELSTTFVAYSPLGRGFLTGSIRRETLDQSDFRLQNPRFQKDAIEQNFKFVEIIKEMATRKGVSPAQIALAWVLSKNEQLAIIPGTRKLSRLKENFASIDVELSQAELKEIESKLPESTMGDRY